LLDLEIVQENSEDLDAVVDAGDADLCNFQRGGCFVLALKEKT
jgi:hypothetical protein